MHVHTLQAQNGLPAYIRAPASRRAGNPFDGPCHPPVLERMGPGFSILLCLRGSFDAIAGLYSNWDAAQEVGRGIRKRVGTLWLRLVRTNQSTVGSMSTAVSK